MHEPDDAPPGAATTIEPTAPSVPRGDVDADDDIDRAAILGRRRRFIASALTGLALSTSADCNPFAPCLEISPVDASLGDASEDASPMDAGAADGDASSEGGPTTTLSASDAGEDAPPDGSPDAPPGATDAGTKDAGKTSPPVTPIAPPTATPPRPCLSPPPRPCLKMAPDF